LKIKRDENFDDVLNEINQINKKKTDE